MVRNLQNPISGKIALKGKFEEMDYFYQFLVAVYQIPYLYLKGALMGRNFSIFLYVFWSIFLLAAVLIYFFAPDVFHRMTQYKGAGSPFVNTPRG